MDEAPSTSRQIIELKEFRVSIDACINECESQYEYSGTVRPSEALVIARQKLIEAKMWAGKHFEYLGQPLPSQYQDKAE